MVGRNILEHPKAKKHEWLAPSSSELDLRDYPAVLAWLQHHQPDLVIHAAGKVGGIHANMREPVSFLLENLDIGRNVVWAARTACVPQLINLASSCMYPRNVSNPLREEMLMQGELEPTNEGYALAKIATVKLCEYISRENPDFQYKSLIPCNIYGPHDKFDPKYSHLLPAILHKLHLAKTDGRQVVDVWGDGSARREFMFVGDLVDCILHATSRFDSLPNLMNVGLGHDWTVNEYYESVARVIGFTGHFYHDRSKPIGMARKLLCTARLQAWGWKATTSLDTGIKATYNHYLQHISNEQL